MSKLRPLLGGLAAIGLLAAFAASGVTSVLSTAAPARSFHNASLIPSPACLGCIGGETATTSEG